MRGGTRAVLTLRQVAPTATSETWEVADTPQQIGRVDGTIRLTDRTVSRRHARISPSPDGFVVEDLGSTGGTYVNDCQITAPTPVHHGDRLGFGDVVLAAEVRQRLASVAGPSTPVQRGSAATLMYVGDPPPPIIVASQADARVSLVDATIAELQASTPAVKIAAPAPRARRKVDAATPRLSQADDVEVQPASEALVKPAGLIPLGAAAEELARSIRTLERELAVILAQFEQNGGARALDALLGRLRRAHALDADSIAELVPGVCRFLEIERALIELLRSERPVT